ncbi:peroxidase [Coprinopsis sp. MPI-PUGE-AT-0042]|nr:peroxidase [Coprinopsis sp. MPI-PUGE-AT-0042]
MKLSVLFTTLAVTLGALAFLREAEHPSDVLVWNEVLEDLQTQTCEILRIVFHDSIAANGGLSPTIEALRETALRHGVSFGDIIQFATAVGMSNCPGSPRLEFLAGRGDATQASPTSLIPGPGNTVDAMLNRMADAGFTPEELVDLLAAHSLASQEGLNAAIFPLDSTPQTFDTQFYIESFRPPWQFRMRSDARLARDPRTACHWQALAARPRFDVHPLPCLPCLRCLLLGFDRNTLTDCSDIIPAAAGITTTPTIPPGLTADDLISSCPTVPFPNIPVAEGAPLPSLLPANFMQP